MIRHIWTILCKNSTIDEETNNISISEIIEQITVGVSNLEKLKDKPKGQPIAVQTDMQLITMWERDSITADRILDTSYELVDSEGRVLGSHVYTNEFKGDGRRFRVRTTINVLPVTKSGVYHYRVKEKINGIYETKAELPLEVVLKVEKSNSITA